MNAPAPTSSPPSLSRLRLVVPPLIPLALLGVLLVPYWRGYEWNAHGGGLFLGVAIQLSSLVVVAFEGFAIHTAVQHLRRDALARTSTNYLCTGFAATFVTLTVVAFLYFSIR
jgi:hypothetical protein